MIAAGAVLAIGASVGTGFAVQSAWAAGNDREAATAALSISTGLHAEQLPAHVGVLDVRAASAAQSALQAASDTVAAASSKADAAGLQTTAAMLGDYKLLAPERVFALVTETKNQTAAVQAAVAEFDRVAAEKAAAEAAAAAERAAVAKSSGGSSSGSRPNAPSDPSAAQAYARDYMASAYGWGEDQFGCLVALWNKESGWNANAYNASSGAGGIPQALPASKMASAGADWATNAETQVRWGLGYIAGRWGTPCGAWDHSQSSGWY